MTKSGKQLAIFGCILCGLGVLMGAFGGHSLEKHLDQVAKNAFEVGVRYQFYHGLALLALASLQNSGAQLLMACRIMLLGVILFSGSLYIYALTGIREFAFVTPVGGVLLILSWIFSLKKIIS